MQSLKIQIQSVIYKNDTTDLERAVECISKAVGYYNTKSDEKLDVNIIYGDASPERVFDGQAFDKIADKYKGTVDLRYTFFNENTGTAKGHNLLAKDADADYILVMDPTVLVAANVFTELLRPFKDKRLNCAIAEARQSPIEISKVFDKKTGETGWASASCALIFAKAFREVSGFDDDTFCTCCFDVDFSWRVRLQGYKVIYCPNAIAVRARRLTMNAGLVAEPSEAYYSAEAALLMSYKWSDKKVLNDLLKEYGASESPDVKKAYDSFIQRKKQDRLPKQLDRAHTVAEFRDGCYAKHKYPL